MSYAKGVRMEFFSHIQRSEGIHSGVQSEQEGGEGEILSENVEERSGLPAAAEILRFSRC